MNRQAGKTIGITLLLAAGLLAVLFDDGIFAPPGAGAQDNTPPPPIRNIVEVDGGRSSEMVFRVNIPTTGRYLDPDDQIKIVLPADFRLPFSIKATKIGFSGSGDPISEEPISADTPGAVSGSILTLTIPNNVAGRFGSEPIEHLVITIEAGSGIVTPETPVGFDNPNEGYDVAISFVADPDSGMETPAADKNIIVVKNPVSSTVPGAARVQVTLVTNTGVQLSSSDEITVDFSGPSADSEFVVPSSIRTTTVRVYPQGLKGNYFNPSNILVQGERVTLTIPPTTPGTRAAPRIDGNSDYAIQFLPGANIGNPYAAGNPKIKVSSSVDRETIDDITAVIRRTTTIDPLVGPRGTEFTLKGGGYADGTVTIFHDADDDEQIDPGETLASVDTVRGAFTVRLTARGKPGILVYRVRTRDSEGVVDRIDFMIESGIFFEPVVGRVGSPLRITISDWQDDYPEEVAAVSIGGELAYFAGETTYFTKVKVKEYDNCFEYSGGFKANRDGVITLEIDVPPNVPEGKQTVSFYGYDDLAHYWITDDGARMDLAPKDPCDDNATRTSTGAFLRSNVKSELKSAPSAIFKETLDIDREELTLSPTTAARGQKVTITGSGFSRASWGDDHIESVWIGGKKVAEDHSWFEVGTNGDIAFAVTVPLDVPDGPNEVLIEGNDRTLGESLLTVPQAAISLNPPQGSRGTDLTITGIGFIANELVSVTYGAGVGAPLGEAKFGGILADRQGGFELEFQVPIIAEVGKRHLVTAVAEEAVKGETVTVEAEASHLITRVNIITTPDIVSPGERLTIRGQHLPTFSLVGPVSIAGIELSLDSDVATDEDGNFETEILIPHIDYGDHTLLVEVAGVISPHIVNVAPPPLNGSPSQVLKYLIRDGFLMTVWHYDNATQSWSVFDPSLDGEMAELNDLTEVGSGDIVWVNLSQPQFFQESELQAGWNLITLK